MQWAGTLQGTATGRAAWSATGCAARAELLRARTAGIATLRAGSFSGIAALKRACAPRIAALQWTGALERAALSLLRSSTLLLTLALLILLVLLLTRQPLGERGATEPDHAGGDYTLRSKCNFIHKFHPVPGSSGSRTKPAISKSRDSAKSGLPLSPTRICTQNTQTRKGFQAVFGGQTRTNVSA
ncbi:MAG: hypothetical protein KIT25_14370 [Enhydrobacter sp.]|nr:MAG: hypothetical protein KIT25_14370 [Enhydrobacter sp.]